MNFGDAHVVDMSDPDAAPGYRVSPDVLSNEAAWDGMQRAARAMVTAALDARLALLDLGFAVGHSLCKELDTTATQYETAFQAVRHQRTPPEAPA